MLVKKIYISCSVHYCYLGSIIHQGGETTKTIVHGRKSAYGILYDHAILIKLMGKFYVLVIGS